MFYPKHRKSFSSWGSNGLRGGGYSVGYSRVTVYNIDSNEVELDRAVYNYINIPDKNLYYTWEEKLLSGGIDRSIKDETSSLVSGIV